VSAEGAPFWDTSPKESSNFPEIHVHQVGFIPIYTPFYVVMNELSKKYGWKIKYHVGISDEVDLKRACQFKYDSAKENKPEIHIVLTALHNLSILTRKPEDQSEEEFCEDCKHKRVMPSCKGLFEDMDWFFPWLFIIKLPVYVFLRGNIKNKEVNEWLENLGIRYQLNWEKIEHILKTGELRRIYIYPKGATINDVVINHILQQHINMVEIKEINFDKEREDKENKIDKDAGPLLVFTLNPHLYEGDPNYTLVMKPAHHFFPFTGIAIPVLRNIGTTVDEIRFLYRLEEEYVNFMSLLQETKSPFFGSSLREKDLNRIIQELKDYLKDIRYTFYDGEGRIFPNQRVPDEKINTFWKHFEKFYNDGVYREHTESVIKDYLKEKTQMEVRLFDTQIYKARVKDSVAYVFARNLSHIYGSNVIPYAIEDIKKSKNLILENFEDFISELTKEQYLMGEEIRALIDVFKYDIENRMNKLNKKVDTFLKYLQERMDYIASIISDENLTLYSFIGYNISELSSLFNGHFGQDDNFLSYLYKSTDRNLILTITEDESLKKELYCAVPPTAYEQAFCSIFENILRNAVKYGKPKKGNKLEFHISAKKDSDEHLIEVSIIDKNLKISSETEKQTLIKELNAKLRKVIVKPDLDIVYESWGLKEIKISAAYLRGIPLDSIDLEDRPDIPIIRVEDDEDGIKFTFRVYPFKEVIEISKREKKETPSEFIIMKDAPDDIKKRKWTRIFTENLKVQDLRKKWLESLLGIDNLSQVLIDEFIEDRENNVEKFYTEIKNKLEKDKVLVAYVRHLRDKLGKKEYINFLKEIKGLSPFSYLHPLKGAGTTYSLFRKVVEEGNEFIRYKLLESALVRILIIDERVQKIVREADTFEELEGYNIFVPKTQLVGDDGAISKEETLKKLEQELVNIQEKYNPHFVVVHVSLLEQADNHIGDGKFANILTGIFNNSDIILTTGRGKVTSHYRDEFGEAVPISHITKAISDRNMINKFVLTNILIGFNRNILFKQILTKN